MVIYNAIRSFEAYEGWIYASPWDTRDSLDDSPIFLYVENEYMIEILFMPSSREYFASARINDEPVSNDNSKLCSCISSLNKQVYFITILIIEGAI